MKCMSARSIATLLFALTTVAPIGGVDINNYFRLINDVHKYYRTTCVIFALPHSKYHDLNTTTLMYTWSRKFSRQRVMTMTVTFADLVREYNNYRSIIVRPLFVILLDTAGTMNEFAKVTSSINPMSFPAWLVIFLQRPGNPLERDCRHPLGNVFNVDFSTLMLVKCYDRPVLMEWYAVRDNRTRTFGLATWSPDRGLILRTRKSLHARRCDMFGQMIRVASVNESPFFMVENDDRISGFLGLLLIELSRAMNFTLEILEPVEAYGSWNRQKNMWTGVIGQLVNDKADIGASEFTLMPGRLNVVDFTLPLIHSRSRLYFRQPDSTDVHWSGYIQTFSCGIWIMIVTIIISSSILLTVMKAKKRISATLLSENYMRVWGIYCQQSLPEFPNELSLRLAFFSIYVSAYIVSSAYSASLISYLALTTASLPFSTLEEYVKDGSYRLIVTKYSAEYDVFDNVKDPVYQKMHELMEEKYLPLALSEGFQQICERKNLAYLTTEAFKNAIDLPCKVVHIDTGRIDNLAMTLPKDSPYTIFMNYQLQRFKDTGILNKLKSKYWLATNRRKAAYNAVNLADIVPILAVMAGGTMLAAFIFTTEKAYYIFNSVFKSNGCLVRKSSNDVHVAKFHGKFQKERSKLDTKLQQFRNIDYVKPFKYQP